LKIPSEIKPPLKQTSGHLPMQTQRSPLFGPSVARSMEQQQHQQNLPKSGGNLAQSMQQSPSQINMTANNQQFMVAQQQSQQQQPQQPLPQNLSNPGGNLASASNYFPVGGIQLPAVPIPTTSMFSSTTPAAASQLVNI
jgi:hypothetical protein